MGRYLTIDIGTKKGRHILGYLKEKKLITEEIYSFDNETCEKDGIVCWDFDYLFGEIKKGLRLCFETGKLPIFIAVSAWDNDFVLLDSDNKVIGTPAACLTNRESLFSQMTETKEKHPEYLEKAESFLLIPDYFNFLLTGTKRSEYYKSQATLLVDEAVKDWNDELIQMLGYPRKIFLRMNEPAAVLGTLTRQVTEELEYDCILLQSLSNTAGAKLFDIRNKSKEAAAEEELSAAAIANLLLHMVCSHELKDFEEARQCVINSFES